MSTAACSEPLSVRTVELDGPEAAAAHALFEAPPDVRPGAFERDLPTSNPVAWVHHGAGLIGWGAAATLSVRGPERFARVVTWWQNLLAAAVVHDELRLPGTGPVLFGSFAFADGPSPSLAIVPRTVLGRRDGRTWLTTIGGGPSTLPALRTPPILPGETPLPPRVRLREGTHSAAHWHDAVTEAVRRIRGGELSKVVLARDLVAEAEEPVDARHLLRELARRFPECFTFAVAGLVGASPELLVRRVGDRVSSRVLAGTAWRAHGGAAESDAALAARLQASGKDLEEHAYAAQSAAEALRPYCSTLSAPASPSVLALSNVVHLSTEVEGTLRADTPALTLAGHLHPTAAVCGTPSSAAARVIADLEDMDRGRYAGPVGWMDARGDGEWGLALRCAQVEGRSLRLFAGCGIVAGSDPDTELAEAEAKFAAVLATLDVALPVDA